MDAESEERDSEPGRGHGQDGEVGQSDGPRGHGTEQKIQK